MTVFYENNRIVFIIKIPLVTSTELTAYNVIPIPVRHLDDAEGVMQVLDPETSFIAITKNREEYTPISSEQMSKCIETNIYRICPMTLTILTNNLVAPCEVYLFNEPKEARVEEIKCRMWTAKLKRNLYHKLKYANEWIYSVYNDRLIITCASISESQIKIIRGEGVIKISDRECQIRTANGILESKEELDTKIYTNFVPKTDMSKLFDKIPNSTLMLNMKHLEIHHDLKCTDMRQATKSLEEVESLIEMEQERQNNYEQIRQQSTILYVTIGLAALSITLIVVIYGIIKCRSPRHPTVYPPMYANPYAMQPMLPTQATAPGSPR